MNRHEPVQQSVGMGSVAAQITIASVDSHSEDTGRGGSRPTYALSGFLDVV